VATAHRCPIDQCIGQLSLFLAIFLYYSVKSLSVTDSMIINNALTKNMHKVDGVIFGRRQFHCTWNSFFQHVLSIHLTYSHYHFSLIFV